MKFIGWEEEGSERNWNDSKSIQLMKKGRKDKTPEESTETRFLRGKSSSR